MKKLDDNNGLEIFRNNEKLRSRVWSDALENESYYQVDEILSYFRHYNTGTQKRYETLSDYSIDYCGAWIKANNNYLKEFFEDCKTIAETFCILDDLHNIQNKINRVIDKIDLYDDAASGYYDMSDKNFYRLEKWINDTKDYLCDYIARYLQSYYEQFDDAGTLEDYFLTYWLEYNNNFEVDDAGNVYETITRVIA